MNYIKTITSEAEIRDDFFKVLRERKVVQQPIHYLGTGAELYYKVAEANIIPSFSEEKDDVYAKFLEAHLPSFYRNHAYVFVSLGCGNAKRERPTLVLLQRDKKHKFKYLGIDTSISMLEMAEKVLNGVKVDVQLVCGDFASKRLQDEIVDQTSYKSGNIFAFLGSTLGNLEVDYTADLLADVMKKGDYLWMDADIREGTDPLSDRRLFEYHRDFAQDKNNMSHSLHALEELGIPRKKGELFIQMEEEETTNALKFYCKFKVLEPISILRRGQHMQLLPGNVITVEEYRAYDPEGLIRFFNQRGFQFIARDDFDGIGQFLFQKR